MSDYDLALQVVAQYNGQISIQTVAEVDYSIIHNDDAIDLIFEGTHDLEDAKRDLDTGMTDAGWGRLHSGAWEGIPQVIDAVWDELHEDRLIRCSGHSLGAMEAAMAACVLYYRGFRNVEAVTFASPRWGDEKAMAWYNKIKNRTYRNYKDMWVHDFFTTIPLWLPTLPFQPVPNETIFWSAPTPNNEWKDAPLNIQAHSMADCVIPGLAKLQCPTAS